jgi:hypothetical protein
MKAGSIPEKHWTNLQYTVTVETWPELEADQDCTWQPHSTVDCINERRENFVIGYEDSPAKSNSAPTSGTIAFKMPLLYM